MHYYSHHIGDFSRDTSNLDDHHLATYMRMLWAYYADEKPFSDDCESIAFAVRSDEKTVSRLLSHYFVLGDDGWRHKRCDKEIAAYHGKAEKARQSANARWNNANGMRTHSDRNANEPFSDANQEPITNNQEEAKEQSPAIAAEPSPAKPKRAKSAGMTLSQFAEQCRSAGQQVIPADDPIFAYAGKVGIPTEYVGLAWRWFKDKYGGSQHKQADWRAHFRNSVRSIWCKYWSIAQDGTVYLTASGKQAQREANA